MQFVVAELINALEYLHKSNIIHRDLKPENVLFNSEGHVVLTDFGTSKFVDEQVAEAESSRRKASFVGTAEYVSPEVLQDKGTSFSSDLWSLGCLIYTSLSGKPPFRGLSEFLTFQNVLKRDLQFPEDFPEHGRDLIDKLVQIDPSARLGSGPDGFEEIKRHPFFSCFSEEDWPDLFLKESPCAHFPAQSYLDKAKHDEKTQTSEEDLQPVGREYWYSFLKSDENIVLTGLVVKTRNFSLKTRMLVLTDSRRFVYFDPVMKRMKGEIPITRDVSVQVVDTTHFRIVCPRRTYFMDAIDYDAQAWKTAFEGVLKEKT